MRPIREHVAVELKQVMGRARRREAVDRVVSKAFMIDERVDSRAADEQIVVCAAKNFVPGGTGSDRVIATSGSDSGHFGAPGEHVVARRTNDCIQGRGQVYRGSRSAALAV